MHEHYSSYRCLKDNTTYGATYGWYRNVQKLPKTWYPTTIEYPTDINSTQSLQENAITGFGPRLYNSSPEYLRDMRKMKSDKFIFELDKFL